MKEIESKSEGEREYISSQTTKLEELRVIEKYLLDPNFDPDKTKAGLTDVRRQIELTIEELKKMGVEIDE